jgi:hypothetical protein
MQAPGRRLRRRFLATVALMSRMIPAISPHLAHARAVADETPALAIGYELLVRLAGVHYRLKLQQ